MRQHLQYANESAGGSAKKSRRSGGDAVEFLKEKAQSEYSIRQQELELQRKEQEARARQQESYRLNCYGSKQTRKCRFFHRH